jgi:hypothetical protein
MIRKSVQRFSEKIMLNNKLKRDDDSSKSSRFRGGTARPAFPKMI